MVRVDPALLAHLHFGVNQGFLLFSTAVAAVIACWLAWFCLRWRFSRRVACLEAYRGLLPIGIVMYAGSLFLALMAVYQGSWLVPGYLGKAGNILGLLQGYGMLCLLWAAAPLWLLWRSRRLADGGSAAVVVILACLLSCGLFCLVAAESWGQVPRAFEVSSGRFHSTDKLLALHFPVLLPRLFHVLLAAALVVAFSLVAVMAWVALRRQLQPAQESLFRSATILAAICLPLQMGLGLVSAQNLVLTQPAKLAALLGHWHSGPATLAITSSREPDPQVPVAAGIASGLLAHDARTPLSGLNEFGADRPPVSLVFVAFRIMLALALLLLMAGWLSAWLLHQRRSQPNALPRAWLRVLVAAGGASWLAAAAGWVVSGMGRYPWAIHGLVRTNEVRGALRVDETFAILAAHGVLYAAVTLLVLTACWRYLTAGPSGY